MRSDEMAMYDEVQVTRDAVSIVSEQWIVAEAGSGAETLLGSIRQYLWDRHDIALEFWAIELDRRRLEAA